MERVPSTDRLWDGRDESLLYSGSCWCFRRYYWIRILRRCCLHPGCRPGSSILLHCLTFADELEERGVASEPFGRLTSTAPPLGTSLPTCAVVDNDVDADQYPFSTHAESPKEGRAKDTTPSSGAKTLWWAQKQKSGRKLISSKTKQELTSIDWVTLARQQSLRSDRLHKRNLTWCRMTSWYPYFFESLHY